MLDHEERKKAKCGNSDSLIRSVVCVWECVLLRCVFFLCILTCCFDCSLRFFPIKNLTKTSMPYCMCFDTYSLTHTHAYMQRTPTHGRDQMIHTQLTQTNTNAFSHSRTHAHTRTHAYGRREIYVVNVLFSWCQTIVVIYYILNDGRC